VEEDDESSAIYDPSSGTLLVKLTKKNHGEVFPDLDLLSKLLAPTPSRSDNPVIEVLEDNNGEQDDEDIAQLTSQLAISSSELQEGPHKLLQVHFSQDAHLDL
jgi:protein SHQ1